MRSSYGAWKSFQNRGANKPTEKLGGAHRATIHQTHERQDRRYTGQVKTIDLQTCTESYATASPKSFNSGLPWWKVKQLG